MSTVNQQASPPLSAEQQAILAVVLDLIIPPAADGAKPGASEVGFAAYAQQAGVAAWLAAGMDSVAEAAAAQHGLPFSALPASEQAALVAGLRRKLFRFFGELANHVMMCYYQHDRVLAGIGMDPRAPFPLGYFPIDGDLSLLEAVYERGPIWRPVPIN